MVFFKLRQLLPLLLALATAGLALAVFDVSLGVIFGSHPRWLPPQLFSGGVSQIGARIARLEQLKASGQVDDIRLVAVVGTSAVQQGFDPRILAAADPHHRIWLVSADGGGSVREVQIYGQVLVDSALKPALVILGIEESMLHSQDEWIHPASLTSLLNHLRNHHFNSALMDISWLDLNRDALVDYKTLLFYRLTRGIQSTFGLPMSAMFLPETDPWSAPPYRYGSYLPAEAMAYQLNSLQPRIDPRQYESNDRQIAALINLTTKLRDRGAKVIAVLMPESSAFRALHPPIIAQRFQEALAQIAVADRPLKLINLRDSMPDNLFYDYVHLNQRGRQRLSELLPKMVP
jgi:hypothetical protein